MGFHAHLPSTANSTRNTAINIWGEEFPTTNYKKNAKILFSCDNPPGSKYISGSQDSIGIIYPGIIKIYYDGEYWPNKIENIVDEDICEWLEKMIYLVPLQERPENFNPIAIKNTEKSIIMELCEAGEKCWDAICSMNIVQLGESLIAQTETCRQILPYTTPDWMMDELVKHPCEGAMFSGAGGGGYIICASSKEMDGIKISIRR